jgi:hypothetical protein
LTFSEESNDRPNALPFGLISTDRMAVAPSTVGMEMHSAMKWTWFTVALIAAAAAAAINLPALGYTGTHRPTGPD